MASTREDKGSNRTRPGWWLLSVGLHVALLSLLLWAPVRERLFEVVEQPIHNVSAERIRKVSEDILRLQKEEAEKKLQELAEIRDRMEEINRRELARFEEFRQLQQASAPERALRLQEAAAAAQESLLEQLEQASQTEGSPTAQDNQKTKAAKTATEREIKHAQEEARKLLESAGLNRSARAQAEANREHAQAAKRVEKFSSEIEKSQKNGEQSKIEDRRHAAEAPREALVKSAERQRHAMDVLRKEMEPRLDAHPDLAKSSSPPPPEAESQTLTSPENLQQALEQAGVMESDILEQTRYSRAMKAAALRREELERVLASTSVAAPNRPELDLSVLDQAATTTMKIKEQRAALREVNSRLDSVAAQAREHLASMLPQEGGVSMSLETLSAAAERHEQLRQMAAEDTSERARDMVAVLAPQRGGAEARGADSTTGLKPLDIRTVMVPRNRDPGNSLPGRRIVSSSHPAAARIPSAPWLYVNTWYVLGPFPNPRRSNIDQRFPPEFVHDLDAKYPGMDGKMISWQFVKGDKLAILPPDDREYGIYYAYTELWFDEDMDLWVAIGSDDNSRIWVNDEIVWLSSYELKGWRFDEGFRRIPFRKGRNRILYRVENGHYVTEFSFGIHLGGREPNDPR